MSMRGDRGGRGRGRGTDSRGGGGGRGGQGGGGGGPGRGDFGQRGGGGGGRGGGPGRGDFGPRGGGGGGRGGRGGASLQVFRYGNEPIPAPDANVTIVEDQTQTSLATKSSQLPDIAELKLTQPLPQRPGYGTQGTSVVLWANYFPLIPNGETKLYRYGVDIIPEVAGGKRRRIIQQLLDETSLSSMKPSIATDQKSTLISCDEISAADLRHTITYKSEGVDEAPPLATRYTVTLGSSDALQVSDLIDYLTSTNASAAFARKTEVVQALNIVVGHHPRIDPNNMSVANKHYAIEGQIKENFDLKGGLIAWRGYFSSVRAATSRILLNVQIKHIATYENIRLDLLMEKFGQFNSNKISLGKFLKRVRVETTHLPDKKNKAEQKIPRVKTIFALATPHDGKKMDHPPKVKEFGATADAVQFYLGGAAPTGSRPGPQLPQNQYITVQRFFKLLHGLDVDAKVPVVNVGNTENPSYLPADVCVVLPGQAARAKLAGNQTAEMIKFAVRTPYNNAQSITSNGQRTLGLLSQNATLAKFGISVSQRMLTVPGRILVAPNVQYRGNTSKKPESGSWNMHKIKFYAGATLKSWAILVIGKEGLFDVKKELDDIMQGFHEALRINGIDASLARGARRIDRSEIEKTFSEFGSVQTAKPELIFVIFPKEDTALYNVVKYQGDIVHGIHTVCVVGSKFSKPGRDGYDLQYFANVALKFNLKMGGVNQVLDSSKLGIVGEGRTMIVGIDVTHPSPGSADTAPSVAGVVASINKNLGQWPAVLKIQDGRKEMVTDLGELFQSRLKLWRKHNGNALPENVIVYRDGVSEGQYNTVLDAELPELRKACEGTYPPVDTKRGLPRISIIIVGKRHHTRFYPTTIDESKIDAKSSNSKNGTIVDRGVTEARNWDFFLQAHTALKGTARPAHYIAVHDEIFAKRPVPEPFHNAADVLEDLTHNMCYLFGRATKAVSICPPAYYADLVCERARRYLCRFYDPDSPMAPSVSGASRDVEVHPTLADKMFYI